MSDIILPRKDENGEYYISYSQFSSWKSKKSFNMGVAGNIEYMASYFHGREFPDAGWAEFGQDVEDYICEKIAPEKFTEEERATMDQVEPLGRFQIETKLYILPGVYIKGFIDDGLEDLSRIRDYKTASENSKKRYYKPDYYQLDIYAAWVYQETGKLPTAEVAIIERKGNCFGMVERRDLLSVGSQIWYHEREITMKRVEKVKADLVAAVFEISDAYKIYLKLKELK